MDRRIVRTLDVMSEAAIVRDLGWEAFLRYKVASYARQNTEYQGRFSLLTYLGMTASEYGEWVAYGEISDRVKRVWS